jgi:hypothetical protein
MTTTRLSIVATLALVLATAADAGRSAGPASKVFLVQGFKALAIKVKFRGNEPAAVQVVGDGDSPLAVAVFDKDGARVVADTKNTDRFTVRWTPAEEQTFTVRVYNRGGVPNRFLLKTN